MNYQRAISILKEYNSGDLTVIIEDLTEKMNLQKYENKALFIFPEIMQYKILDYNAQNPIIIDGVKRFAYGQNVVTGHNDIAEWIENYNDNYSLAK